jgi:hypothetical protein
MASSSEDAISTRGIMKEEEIRYHGKRVKISGGTTVCLMGREPYDF